MKRGYVLLLALVIICTTSFAQQQTEKPTSAKNVILLIGDGMGVSQIYAGMTANKGHLNLERFHHIGFSKTYSADDFITDSGAGGTALSSGYKTFNHAIGVDPDSIAHQTILEIASNRTCCHQRNNPRNTGIIYRPCT